MDRPALAASAPAASDGGPGTGINTGVRTLAPPPVDDDAVVVAPVGAAGRGVVAARPLPAGVVVLVEAPIAAVAVEAVSPGTDPVCAHCYG